MRDIAPKSLLTSKLGLHLNWKVLHYHKWNIFISTVTTSFLHSDAISFFHGIYFICIDFSSILSWPLFHSFTAPNSFLHDIYFICVDFDFIHSWHLHHLCFILPSYYFIQYFILLSFFSVYISILVYCQGPLYISKYGKCSNTKLKIAIKWWKNWK